MYAYIALTNKLLAGNRACALYNVNPLTIKCLKLLHVKKSESETFLSIALFQMSYIPNTLRKLLFKRHYEYDMITSTSGLGHHNYYLSQHKISEDIGTNDIRKYVTNHQAG